MSERKYAPRSGGRTAEQRSATKSGTRRYPTQGSAALKAEAAAEPLPGTGAGRARAVEPREIDVTPRLQVAPPAPISAPRAPFIAVVIAIVVAGVIGILLINTKTNENTFEISKLQDQKTALDNQQQKLENQIAGYESTGNLDVAARRLGLVKSPGSPAYIRLPDGQVIGVPKPGTGPEAVTAQDPTRSASDAPDGDAQNGVSPEGTTGGNGTVQSGAVQDGTVQGGQAQNGVNQGDSGTQGDSGQDGSAGQDAGDQSAG